MMVGGWAFPRRLDQSSLPILALARRGVSLDLFASGLSLLSDLVAWVFEQTLKRGESVLGVFSREAEEFGRVESHGSGVVFE